MTPFGLRVSGIVKYFTGDYVLLSHIPSWSVQKLMINLEVSFLHCIVLPAWRWLSNRESDINKEKSWTTQRLGLCTRWKSDCEGKCTGNRAERPQSCLQIAGQGWQW